VHEGGKLFEPGVVLFRFSRAHFFQLDSLVIHNSAHIRRRVCHIDTSGSGSARDAGEYRTLNRAANSNARNPQTICIHQEMISECYRPKSSTAHRCRIDTTQTRSAVFLSDLSLPATEGISAVQVSEQSYDTILSQTSIRAIQRLVSIRIQLPQPTAIPLQGQ
jgi:hypothetical protein